MQTYRANFTGTGSMPSPGDHGRAPVGPPLAYVIKDAAGPAAP
jgi:hypothetical protein